jgi:HSP20 family protein
MIIMRIRFLIRYQKGGKKMTECMDNAPESTVMPCMYINHDMENYYAQVELPGVKKDDIDLTVSENGMCIKGKNGEQDISGCWMLAHNVQIDDVKAKYDEGLLDITLPFKHPMKSGKSVKIE